jgi:hypothetical protein
MQTDPRRTSFERLVVYPIENGYIVEIEANSEETVHAFKTYRQVLRFLKTLE